MSNIERYLRKPEEKNANSKLNRIDCVYLINLEQRPLKLQQTLNQFAPFGIRPCRLPAIYGWGLSFDALQDIGLRFQPGMDTGAYKAYRAVLFPQTQRMEPLDAACYGRACFHPRLTPGAIGCMLSHLSVLQDAYDSGFQTIWILEDDIRVAENPHLLSEEIEALDKADPDWDLLYTDDRTHFDPFTPGTVWRPDMELCYDTLYTYSPLGEQFMRIGGRCQMHSVLMRRSGIEKILSFYKARGIFMPYDVEAAFISGIRLYNLRHEIVWGGSAVLSDTDYQNPI